MVTRTPSDERNRNGHALLYELGEIKYEHDRPTSKYLRYPVLFRLDRSNGNLFVICYLLSR